MDLCTKISSLSTKAIQGGTLFKKIPSADGTKIVSRITSDNSVYIDIFDRNTNRCIHSYRKVFQPDGQSYTTKSFNFLKKKGSIRAYQKLDGKNSIRASFKVNQNGVPEKTGDILDLNGVNQKGGISYSYATNSIATDDRNLSVLVSVFNKLFGPIKF